MRTVVAILFLSLIGISGSGQSIELDLDFGDSGKVIHRTKGPMMSNKILVQPDGKFIVTGALFNRKSIKGKSTGNEFVLLRFDEDGSLDNSFGKKGMVLTDFEENVYYGGMSALQSDGKIVVAGILGNANERDYVMTRYLNNGQLDKSFGDNGIRITRLGEQNINASNIFIQPDDKIIFSGSTFNGNDLDLLLIRYTKIGDLDTAFGDDGVVTKDFAGYDDSVGAISMKPDGELIIGCSNRKERTASSHEFLVASYKSNGVVDTAFGENDYTMVDIDGFMSQVVSLTLLNNGKITLVGRSHFREGKLYELIFIRFNSNGMLDENFGNAGIIKKKVSTETIYPTGAFLQADEKLIVFGVVPRLENEFRLYDFALARYNIDGTKDISFNKTGMIKTPFDKSSMIVSIGIQSDGGLIALGSPFVDKNGASLTNKKSRIPIVRYRIK